jgi:hypothetical protein
MKRPRKKEKWKLKHLVTQADMLGLGQIAEKVSYEFSQYHRCGPNGASAKKRTKPASHCPREWTPREAINALRASIRSGNVSAGWTPDGFPRHAWHKEGEVWYEVRTENNANGRYHGYPVDELQVPEKLLKKSVF